MKEIYIKNNLPKTELPFNNSKPIDQLKIIDGINLMINEHQKAALAVYESSEAIELAVNSIYEHLTLSKRGRLIYVGAGTSGRIGIQDGVELLPTFNWPDDRLDFIIAGGDQAVLKSVENSEDDIHAAEEAVKSKLINYHDVVIGIAASGNTPFTCKVTEEAKAKKALTIVLSNNPKGNLLEFGKVKIILNTKEEVIAGSTRLKAGTAQKICLNIISSMVMVKLGRVKNGLMNNVVPSNEKLRKRKNMIDTSIF